MDDLSFEDSLKTLATIMRVERIDPDLKFADLGADSLDEIEWVYHLIGNRGLSFEEEVAILDGVWNSSPREVYSQVTRGILRHPHEPA